MLCDDAGVSAQFYEWSCSPLDANTGTFALPDLQYGNDENVAGIGDLMSNSIDFDVYLIPPTLNCNGTVSAVEFCYFGGTEFGVILGTNTSVLDLFTLEQNGTTFRITNEINIYSTPTREICTDRFFDDFSLTIRYCCDKFTLNFADQFHLPALNFALGAMLSSGAISALSYDVNSFPQFRVESFQYLFPFDAIATGDTLSLADATRRTDRALRYIQLAISKPNSF